MSTYLALNEVNHSTDTTTLQGGSGQTGGAVLSVDSVASAVGVRGSSARGSGISGQSNDGIGVWASSSRGWGLVVLGYSNRAAFFYGDVTITGKLTTAARAVSRIDHPLDPENKYLQHTDVVSPESLNLYSGNIVTDSTGTATVRLPDYFEASNTDVRYQLTVIGEPALASVSEEVRGNQFEIKTDRPNVKVSWQVIGVSKAVAADSITAAAEKPPEARGSYLHPQAFGQPEDRAEHHHMYEQFAKAHGHRSA